MKIPQETNIGLEETNYAHYLVSSFQTENWTIWPSQNRVHHNSQYFLLQ